MSTVILGAGIVGLRTATVLLEQIPATRISILAADLPWDINPSPSYSSHWSYAFQMRSDFADADDEDDQVNPLDVKKTEARLIRELADDLTCSAHEVVHQLLRHDQKAIAEAALKQSPDEVTRIPATETLPSGAAIGIEYKHFAYSAAEYMAWLADKLKLQGVVFQRIHLDSLSEIFNHVPDLQAIFNCSNGSFHLANVEDESFKVEHQYIAYVRAPWIDKSRTIRGAAIRGANGRWTQYIKRKNGLVALHAEGGSRDTEAEYVKRECLELSEGHLLAPAFRRKGNWRNLDVVGEKAVSWVSSANGPRVELDLKSLELRGVPVIHHYGHGACGFSTSWGTAERAVELYTQHQKRGSSSKAEL